MQMNSRPSQVRYLVAVAEEGQITRAARRLGIAQPVLSQAVSQLEAELGIELLERHPRGVVLTPAGEAFLVKVRAALAAETDAAETAGSLARAARGELVIGFVGPPPPVSMPELFQAFSGSQPDAHLVLRDLPFPSGSTASWLAGVDLAICHAPATEDGVCVQPFRSEPRALVVPAGHRLAGIGEVGVEEVLDETFVSYHPTVQREWAAFHTLDDHRGGPPASSTADHAINSLQMAGIMSSTRAVTAVPLRDATLARQLMESIVAIPLLDAHPATISLVWRREDGNPLLQAFLASARGVTARDDGI